MKYLLPLILFLIPFSVDAASITFTKSNVVIKKVVNARSQAQNIIVPKPSYNVYAMQRDNILWNDFVETAVIVAQDLDYPVSVLLGQAAIESARGSSHFAQTRYNFFGINAVDRNPDLAYGYEDMEKGIIAYINLIKNNYPIAYSHRHDPYKMIQLIKDRGYATDPDYVPKVTSMPEFYKNL